MDTAGVIRRVQRIFGDSNEIQIKKTDIYDWINDGQLEIIRQTDCYLLSTGWSVVTVPNDYQFGFELPDDFIRVSAVKFVGCPDLVQTVEPDVPWDPNTQSSWADVPSQFYIVGNRLYVYPIPNKTGTNILTLVYIGTPSEIIDDSDLLSIPEVLRPDLVRYCLAQAHDLNENYQAKNDALNEFQARLGMSRDEQNQPVDSYPVVRDDYVW